MTCVSMLHPRGGSRTGAGNGSCPPREREVAWQRQREVAGLTGPLSLPGVRFGGLHPGERHLHSGLLYCPRVRPVCKRQSALMGRRKMRVVVVMLMKMGDPGILCDGGDLVR